jgi:hypothetical protein
MMSASPADQLLTLAEMGAAFAGFTAIAGLLANEIRVRQIAKTNFWLMIEFSFGLIVFSIFPIVLFNFQLSETIVWSISSATMATFVPVHLLTVGRWLIVPAMQRGELNPWGPRIVVPLFLALFTIQGLNAIGVGFNQTFAAYFLGLAFFILMVFFNFASLLAQIWITDDQGGV